MAAQFYSTAGVSSFVNVNKSLTLTGVRPSDGSLRPEAGPRVLLTDLRYEEAASLAWDSDRDPRLPEATLHYFPENLISLDQSQLTSKFLAVYRESIKTRLDTESLEDVHKKGSARLTMMISLMSTETIKETHSVLSQEEKQGMVAMFEELVLQAGTSAAAMFILVSLWKKSNIIKATACSSVCKACL